MKNYSKILFFSMILMASVFSLVLLFKGDFSAKRGPAVVDVRREERKIITAQKPVKRFPAGLPETAPRVPSRDKEAVRPPRFIEPVVHIEKDRYGRDVVANEIVIGFKRGTPTTAARVIEQKYGLLLKQYDPVLGVAHFKIPAVSHYQRDQLQRIIPEREPDVITAQPNAFVQMLASPMEVAKTGIWYIKNNLAVHKLYTDGNFYLARDNGRWFITQCTEMDESGGCFKDVKFPIIEDVDISWGAWGVNAPYFNGALSCVRADNKPILAVVDSGFDTLSPDMASRLDLARAKNVNCDKNNKPTAHFDIETHKSCYQDPDNPDDAEILKRFLDRVSDDLSVQIHMTHGNAVAQIAMAAANGGGRNKNMVGVCLAEQDRLIPVLMGKLQEDDQTKELDYRFTTVDGFNGVVAAVNSGAKVINASWSADVGGVENWTEDEGVKYPADLALLRAVQYAQENGAFIVAAAGNTASDNDQNPVAPANLSEYFDNVIAVGGIDPTGRLWLGPAAGEGSHYGQRSVSLLSAGVRFSFPVLSEAFKTLLPPGYTYPDNSVLNSAAIFYVNGTSGSAPIVSAVAAMIYVVLHNRFGDPADPQQTYNYAPKIKEILTSAAIANIADSADPRSHCKGPNDAPITDSVRHGCLNAAAAMDDATAFAANANNLTQLTVLTTTMTEDPITIESGGAGIAAVSEEKGGGGGGCGFILTHDGSGPGGNWPLLLLPFIPLFLMVRRRIQVTIESKIRKIFIP